MIAAPADGECCCCRVDPGFGTGPMDGHPRQRTGCEDSNPELPEDDDAEVTFIADKLRELQGRRYEMVSRWHRGGHSGAHRTPTQEFSSTDWTVPRVVTVSSDREDDSVERTTSEAHSATYRMDEALLQLRHELVSLLAEDDAVFDQLLSIRRTIAQLRQQNDDLYDDAEVTYLSANCGSLRYRYRSSVRKSPLVDGCRCLTSCEQSSEDSGVSLESSGVSSPSLSPSPAVVATSDPPTIRRDASFRRDSVTFPLSRPRHSRYDALAAGSGLSKNRSAVSVVDADVRGPPLKTSFSGSEGRSVRGTPPVLLVRSRSVTLLPRGVLIRREESYDSGIVATPTDAEVFV